MTDSNTHHSNTTLPHPEDGAGRLQLSWISTYRGELMGLAMIFIVLFHIPLSRLDPFFGLRRMGNIGVDMFFFLSGIGLWYSWTRNPDYRQFFLRRYLRIYPAWLIMASLYYIPRFRGGDIMAWADLVGDIAINWDFWLHDELTFWYIPATMMLYLFAPAYMNLIRRVPVYRWLPVAMIMWCVAVQWVTPIHQAAGHIEIFWSRVPIFFIGIGMAEAVRRKVSLERDAIWLVALVFALGLGTSLYLEQMKHGQFPLFIERMVYIPTTITALLLLGLVLRRSPERLRQGLRFVGAVSLECYLIHIHFVLHYLPKSWSYWPTFLACFAITLPLAWLLGKTAEWISAQLSKHIPT